MGVTPDVGLFYIGIKVDQQPISIPGEYLKDLFKINILEKPTEELNNNNFRHKVNKPDR